MRCTTRSYADRRFDNRREVARRRDMASGVQLPISNWSRISVELKFAHRCSICLYGQLPTPLPLG